MFYSVWYNALGRLWWLFLISVTCPDVTVFNVEGSFSGLSTTVISTHSFSPSAMADGGSECVEITLVDSPENEPTTLKTVTSGQVTEIKKSHHNLPCALYHTL